MTTQIVTIHYLSPTLVKVVPNPVNVDSGDAIQFVQAPGMVGKMRLTFTESKFFKTDNPRFAEKGEFHLVDGLVRVETPLSQRTTYICQLLDEITGDEIARSGDQEGGAVDPVRPH